MVDLVPPWLRWLLLIAAVLAACAWATHAIDEHDEAVREEGRAEIRAQWRDQVAIEQAAENRKALKTRERAMEADDVHAQALARALADAADARAAGDRLREDADAFAAAWGAAGTCGAPAGEGAGQQGAGAGGVLAGVLRRIDDAAGELASYAERLKAAGALCEQRYDALSP